MKQRVALAGEYDATRREELAAALDSLEGDGPVIIDLTDVTYLDATALLELSALRLRDPARSIALIGASRDLRRTLHLVCFDRVFDIRDAGA